MSNSNGFSSSYPTPSYDINSEISNFFMYWDGGFDMIENLLIISVVRILTTEQDAISSNEALTLFKVYLPTWNKFFHGTAAKLKFLIESFR